VKHALVVLTLPVALACTGSVTGELPADDGAPSGNGVGGTTSVAGGGGAGGPTGSAGASVDPEANVPGRTPMRRLTITEYAYTVRDLLGEDVTSLVASFPADGRSTYGFDNIAASLEVQTSQLDVLEQAADTLATRAVMPGSAARQRLAICSDWEDAACRRKVLQTFADKAWRRPTTPAEVDQLTALGATAGPSGDEQVALALRGILLAPQFLFRVEKLPPAGTAGRYRVSAHELATRLSYFLWSSMPDDALAQSAAAGTLASAADVSREVARMLGDPKASGLTENFGAQWLALRGLGGDHAVDAAFTDYTPALAASMAKETLGLFGHVLSNGLPAAELLTARYSFVDEPLAKFYGVPVAGGRAELGATERRGVLGQAALLTLTSYPNRTSIVRRGVWVLDNLLCTEPPPPPEDLKIEEPDTSKGTLRERMASHRSNNSCAACHNLMDPIGLGLENFDAIGRYRETENGATIDASGTYSDGRTFRKPSELATLIAEDPRFVTCVTDKLLAFGLGRVLSSGDHAAAAAVSQALGATASLRDLIVSTAQSQVFAEQEVEP
jgi:Protein of unknown function (DUF1592)/Protein of unknown function (DUF1588)/Protein of unknown function (DUF1587)/Protein of unknown function (DUF1595)/Protein of unknown function (DUF1585)